MTTFPRPVPRLSTALQRLGMSAAVAAYVVSSHRSEYAHLTLSGALIRIAILQRHTPLVVNPRAPRDPSAYRPGFGRFPGGRPS